MIIGSLPTALRIAAVSSGEQTKDFAPADTAIFAKATALSSAGLAKPTSKRSSSDSEVKMVTAVTLTSGTACAAALTISRPPLACTVKNLGDK